jgi:hypothetical protein
MRLKFFIYSALFILSFIFDVILGTFSYPKAFLIACAIVGVYEFVSPYFYT